MNRRGESTSMRRDPNRRFRNFLVRGPSLSENLNDRRLLVRIPSSLASDTVGTTSALSVVRDPTTKTD